MFLWIVLFLQLGGKSSETSEALLAAAKIATPSSSQREEETSADSDATQLSIKRWTLEPIRAHFDGGVPLCHEVPVKADFFRYVERNRCI